jgi:hypothetical protein
VQLGNNLRASALVQSIDVLGGDDDGGREAQLE